MPVPAVVTANIITDLTDRLGSWSANWWFLAVVFAIAFFDSVVPVVPSETTVIIAGVAVATGDAEYALWTVIIAGAVGAFLGDGQNRAVADANADFATRITFRPFQRSRGPLSEVRELGLAGFQIGVSGRVGWRAQSGVSYPYPALTTNQGFSLWDGRYTDSLGRSILTIPSGAQAVVGGEVRMPIGNFDFRGEGYWVRNETREAVSGFETTNSERLGVVEGGAFYVMLAGWLGDAHVRGMPGLAGRPPNIDPSRKLPKPMRGVELAVQGGAGVANVKGAARGGVADSRTPGSGQPNAPNGDLTVAQVGAIASYWHTRHVRVSLSYQLYIAPKSGSLDNPALVAGHLGEGPDPGQHPLPELGARAAVSF